MKSFLWCECRYESERENQVCACLQNVMALFVSERERTLVRCLYTVLETDSEKKEFTHVQRVSPVF